MCVKCRTSDTVTLARAQIAAARAIDLQFWTRDRRPGWAITKSAARNKKVVWVRKMLWDVRAYMARVTMATGAKPETRASARSAATHYIHNARAAGVAHSSLGRSCALTERTAPAGGSQRAAQGAPHATNTRRTCTGELFQPFHFLQRLGVVFSRFGEFSFFNFPGRFFAAFWGDFYGYWAKSLYVSGVCHCATCARWWLQKKSLQGASWESKTLWADRPPRGGCFRCNPLSSSLCLYVCLPLLVKCRGGSQGIALRSHYFSFTLRRARWGEGSAGWLGTAGVQTCN